jgi:soluble lytic murein transglycosylase
MDYREGSCEAALKWLDFLLAASDLFPDDGERILESSPDISVGEAEESTGISDAEENGEEEDDEEEVGEENADEEASPEKPSLSLILQQRRFVERAAYWRARILQSLGRLEEARDGYRRIQEQFPFGYYALMSQQRLAGMNKDASVPAKPASDPSEAPEGAPAPLASGELHPEVAAAASYLRMGMKAECRTTLTALRRKYLEAPDLRAASLVWRALGDHRRSHRMSPVPWEGGLPRPLDTTEARLDAELAYPQAFGSIVHSDATDPAVEPALLFALMRAESGFMPKARSTARALGLTQVIRRTAYRTARKMKLRGFRFWKLYDPEVSIRVGSAYLGSLLERYGNQQALALAAYNAGERAVDRWLTRRGDLELDEFLEEIPYAETNRYVKKVLSFMSIYRALYMPPREIPLQMNFTLPDKVVKRARKTHLHYRQLRNQAKKDRDGG